MSPPEALPTWSDFLAGLDLFLDPILCGAVAGLALGYLGVFIILRRMVFVSAAVTHSAGLGVALAFYARIHLGPGAGEGRSRLVRALIRTVGLLLAIDPLIGAFLFGLGSTLLLALNPARIRLTRESVIGLVFIFSSGAALLVGDRIAQESHDIHTILFGTAVMVSKTDLYTTIAASSLVLALHLWLRRGLVYVSFDEMSARVQGLPVRLLGALLLASIGVMVSVTTRALGAMPVFAFSVLPAMASLSLGVRLHLALALAAIFGAVSAVVGYLFSFFLHFPVGACQTVVAAALAGVAMAFRFLRTR